MLFKRILTIFALTFFAVFLIIYLYTHYFRNTKFASPLSPAITQEVVTILSQVFKQPIAIKSTIQMSEPDRRNLVVRIGLKGHDKMVPATVIFKQSLPRNKSNNNDSEVLSRFAREYAGIEFVNTLPDADQLTFKLYGGSKEHKFILLEDLGEKHMSLLDYLNGSDQEVATEMLGNYKHCLGTLHAESYGKTDEYYEFLRALNSLQPTWQEELNERIQDTFGTMETLLTKLATPFTQDLQQEVVKVLEAVYAPGPFTTFIHGDCCPGNDFINPETGKLKFIDFESGTVRSALIDAVLPRMSFSSCGGAKCLPEDVINQIETIYRAVILEKIPAARNDDEYYEAYSNACAYWALSTLWAANKVWDKDELNWRPGILSSLQAFVDVARAHNKLPNMQNLVELVMQAAQEHWHSAQLELYPAYR